MAAYSAIAETSESLLGLLREEVTERSDVVDVHGSEIALVSPADASSDPDVRLSLYLYSVTENSAMKNSERQVVEQDTLRDPPKALDLNYLLTAFPSRGGTDETTNSIDQQRVLGLAIQVLNDNSILSTADLRGSLGENEIHVTQERDHGTIMDVWNTFRETPYHPSISYRVSPVLIDSTVERDVSRVTERDFEYRRD